MNQKFTHIEDGQVRELGYRKPGYSVGDLSDLVDAVKTGEKVVLSMSLQEVKDALEDGSILEGMDQESIEEIHSQI